MGLSIGDIGGSISDAVSSIGDIGGDIIDSIGGSLDDIARIGLPIAASLVPGIGPYAAAGTALLGLTGQPSYSITTPITLSLDGILTSLDSVLDAISSTVGDKVGDALVDTSRVSDYLAQQIQQLVGSAVGAVVDVDSDVAQRLIRLIADFADGAAGRLDITNRFVIQGLRTLAEQAGQSVLDVGQQIVTRAEQLLNAQLSQQLSFGKLVTDAVRTNLQAAELLWREFAQTQIDLLSAQVAGEEAVAARITSGADSLTQAITGGLGRLGVDLASAIGNPLSLLGRQIWDGAASTLSDAIGDDTERVETAARRAASGQLCGSEFTGDLAALLDDFLPENPIIRWVLSALIGAFSWLAVGSGITSAQAQTILHEYAQRCPYRVLSPPDAILAYWRGQMTQDELFTAIQAEGYSRADAQNMLISSIQLPNELDLLGMLFRGIVTDDEFVDAMRARGWDSGWTARMRESGKLLPPVQDLISMAVREAFTPDAVKEFGLDRDFPEELAFWAEKQGVSRDWAEKYWSAHWGLPSVQMGYEMLHRGVITPAQLKALMKALDIVPAWRDNLIAISYSPYTRVDIRRMHKLGILSAEEVTRAYKDLGYDETRAANLTRFTIELNKPNQAPDPKDLADLTRTQVLAFFTDGIFDEATAVALLQAQGYEPVVAELFVRQRALDIERAERKEAIGLIVERVKSGDLTFDSAEDALNRLNLAPAEMAKAINQVTRAETASRRRPTKADLDTMLEAGILTQEQYHHNLLLDGYPRIWADRYLRLAGGDPDAIPP